ncbi:hypothetical protein AX17_003985 [Amanita inopinata Kibby_2008]|nr:hypothetical protein AX17_003985 [Amanita inopinata Kibby_2008]
MLTIKWNRERFYLDLPPPTTTLIHLRHLIAQQTHLAPDAFKLIHSGAVMKDDNAPISAYHLRPNSSVTLIALTPLAEPQNRSFSAQLSHKTQPSAPRTEQSIITLIHAELARVRTDLMPGVEAFLESHGLYKESQPPQERPPTHDFEYPNVLPEPQLYYSDTNRTTLGAKPPSQYPVMTLPSLSQQDTSSFPHQLEHQTPPVLEPSNRQAQEKEHIRLGELLLQSLIRLDGITTDGDWEHARRERKAAVREVQTLLDRLDGGWAEMQKTSL